MPRVRKVIPVYEENNGVLHEEHQCVNTRVSHYLELYAKGMMPELPKTYRDEIHTPEEVNNDLLNGRLPLPSRATEPVEILEYLNSNKEHFENLVKDFDLAVKDKKEYDECMKIVNDKNSTSEQVYDAMSKLDAIERRARARAN